MANNDNTNRSDPISIPFSAQRGRNRSMSVSSASSGSVSSASEIATPASTSASQRISIPSPSTSPILSFFLAQSPTAAKTPSTAGFPFKHKFGTAPVFEEEIMEAETPIAAHARRASATMSSRFTQNPPTAPYAEGVQSGRGANVLRRLSLSSTAFKLDPNGRGQQPPSPPPNSAVSPTAHSAAAAPFSNKPRRSATISVDSPNKAARRAPSPMGERILKGHFDGFN